jgi:hypothetical protein
MPNDTIDSDLNLGPIARLTRDLRTGAATLGDDQARFLVDAYYIMQEDRKRSYAQARTLEANEEPNDIITWLAEQSATLEKQITSALDVYTRSHIMGSWMRKIYGIGPVLAAGILAHIDIEKAPTAGHIWQFAGIAGDNQRPWEKNKKRPFNATLKTLCWKIGQSFMKFSNVDECYYGTIYRERKAYEIARNESGTLRDYALARAEKVKKTTEAYKHYSEGRLPPGQIDARARRYAVKLFLSHLHCEWYRRHFNEEPPLPYPVAFLGHAHVVKSPV